MAVQTFNPTDLSQSTANWAVAQRIVGPFAPHAQVTPNLTVALDPGYLLSGTTLTEVNAQSVGPFVPPTSGFRIDRVVIDRSTGVASIVTGAANTVTPPTIPMGTFPAAQLHFQSTTLTITNDIIVDERVIAATFSPPAANAIGFRADLNGVNMTIAAGVTTLVPMNVTSSQAFNIGDAFDPETHRFKPNRPGLYQVNGQLHYWNMAAGGMCTAVIFKNGAPHSNNHVIAHGGSVAAHVSSVIQLNGTTDYLELYGYYNNGTGNYISGQMTSSWFSAAYTA
ncbi:hypothetical protein [Azospirillum doebereinerae]|uniref:C1q domain-containing protein n=1 Tax=Azospirillum doebereinerae TaxID=92933 RepID=A0A433JF49_9PROT|nr:hypothetical protein [Azospirillum doebereinerae]RUQ75792.1 hypothetical protein EJ913_01380 [Azospirillum doebereinerae]